MVKVKDVLIINSYAGSLTIAATNLGLKIRGSYEDAGFGLRTQRLNFPDLPYLERLPWPKQDLSGTVVIAHPPCAAFSRQNIISTAQGTGAGSFACHERVMKYALGQGCLALAIESVPAFLTAAAKVHERFAKKYGYHLYRIRQNAVTFGVPQYRERAWVVYTRLPRLLLHHQPEVRTLGQILRARGTNPPPNYEMTSFYRLMAAAGYSQARVQETFLTGEDTGGFLQLAARKLGIEDPGPNHGKVRERLKLGGRFGSKLPRVLNPEGVATVLLRDSNFYVMGRELFLEEYLELMGFPPTYRFHEKDLKDFKCYLSKGVCPPVARWVLRELLTNLKGAADAWTVGTEQLKVLEPGETADFTVSRSSLRQKALEFA